MKKLGKAIFFLLLFLIIFVTILIISLPRIISSERIKETLLAKFSNLTPRQLEVKKIEASLFKGIVFHGLKLSNHPQFTPASFFKAKKIVLLPAFWPLILRKLVIRKIVVESPSVLIERNKQGEFNYEDFLRKAPPAKKGRKRKIDFTILRFRLKDGQVLFRDYSRNVPEVKVEKINLVTKTTLGFKKLFLTLSAEIGNAFLKISASGTEIFKKGDIEVRGNLEKLKVENFSVYLPSFKGVELRKGEVDVDFKLWLKKFSQFMFQGELLSENLGVSLQKVANFGGKLRIGFEGEGEFVNRRFQLKKLKFSPSQSAFELQSKGLKRPCQIFLSQGEINVEEKEKLKIEKLAFLIQEKSQVKLDTALHFEEEVFLKGKVEGELETSSLSELIELPQEISLHGLTKLEANFEGALPEVKLRGSLDMTPSEFKSKYFVKPVGIINKIDFTGQYSDGEIKIDEALLTLDTFSLTAQGNWRVKGVNLNFSSNKFSLEKVLPLIKVDLPPAVKIKGGGKINGSYIKGETTFFKSLLSFWDIHLLSSEQEQKIGKIIAAITYTPSGLEIEKIALRLSQSNFTLTGRVRKKLSQFSFNLNSPYLDIEELIELAPLVSAFKKKSTCSPRNGVFTTQGTLRINRGRYGQNYFHAFQGRIKFKNKKLEVIIKKVNLFGGNFRGRVNFDLQGETFQYQLKSTIQDLGVNEILKANTKYSFLFGKLSGECKIKGKGKRTDTLLGGGNFSIKHGRIINLPPLKRLSTVLKFPELEKINFEKLGLAFKLEEGWINTHQIKLTTPHYVLLGDGKFSLKGELKYKLVLRLSPEYIQHFLTTSGFEKRLPEIAVGDLELLTPKDYRECLQTIPFKITGSYSQPEVSVDWAYLGAKIKKKLSQRIQKAVKEKISEGLKKFLPKRND
jgi:hypothetical protein